MKLEELYGVDKTGSVKVWNVHTEDDTIFVKHGKLGGKQQTKSTVCKAKNIGKANETTPEEQAVSEAKSKWNKQYDKYYRTSIEEAKELLTEGVMLAQDYSKKPHFLKDNFYVSRKLDGLRVKTTLKDSEMLWHSRGGKTYPIPDHVKNDLNILMNDMGLTSLDGETYIHGEKVQTIQSAVKKHKEITSKVTYEIFDIPMLNVPWEERLNELRKVMLRIHELDLKNINVVQQYFISKSQLDNFLKQFLSEGYEGAMMRNVGGEYLFQNKRSNDLLKYKIMFDSECKVIACVEDKNSQGKFTVEWVSDNGDTVTFDLSMNGSHDDNAYEKLSKRIGEWVTFKYQDLTEDGVPTFARGLNFRECDDKGKPLE